MKISQATERATHAESIKSQALRDRLVPQQQCTETPAYLYISSGIGFFLIGVVFVGLVIYLVFCLKSKRKQRRRSPPHIPPPVFFRKTNAHTPRSASSPLSLLSSPLSFVDRRSHVAEIYNEA